MDNFISLQLSSQLEATQWTQHGCGDYTQSRNAAQTETIRAGAPSLSQGPGLAWPGLSALLPTGHIL